MIFKPSNIKVNGGNAWITDTGILCIMRTGRSVLTLSKEEGWPTLHEVFEVAEKLLQSSVFYAAFDKELNQITLINKQL